MIYIGSRNIKTVDTLIVILIALVLCKYLNDPVETIDFRLYLNRKLHRSQSKLRVGNSPGPVDRSTGLDRHRFAIWRDLPIGFGDHDAA